MTHTLAHYDEMAHALLDAYDLGTPEAMQRHWNLTWHQRSWSAMRTYVQIDLGRVAGPDVVITIDDARWLVARESDFEDWDALVRSIGNGEHSDEVIAKPMGVFAIGADESTRPESRSRRWRDVLEQLSDTSSAGLHANGQLIDAHAADLAPLAHLTSLRLDGSQQLSDAGVRHLARLPNLRHLDLQGTSVTDEGLAALSELSSLETLSLAWTAVTDAGTASLRTLDRLQRIDLMGTRCGDGSIRTFAGKTALRHVRTGSGVTDAGLTAFNDYPVFRSWQGGATSMELLRAGAEPNSLTLRGAITDRGMISLAGLHGVFALDIDDARLGLSANALEPLMGLEHLGRLAFDAKDDAMPAIARLPHLRFLSCQDTTASDDAWAMLGASRSIEAIWGRRCHGLADRGFAALSRMPALTKLSVSCLNVSDAALAALPSFPALRELMPMDVPDAGYRHIGQCDQLDALILMYCRNTTDAATTHITRLPKLAYYFASYTQVTDATPHMLAGMQSLERVTFDSCAGITDDGVAALARLPRLREVRVSGRGLTAAVRARFPEDVTVHFAL